MRVLAAVLLLVGVANGFFVPGPCKGLTSVAVPSTTARTSSSPTMMVVGSKSKPTPEIKPDPLVIAPDYRVAAGFFVSGLGLTLTGNQGAGIPFALIGAFLASRTQKVRFLFDDEAMEVMTVGSDGELELSGDNFAVGGRNRWAYDTFTNWEFYPSPQLPILVYFKETQTKPEGQIHFFPVIGNPTDLYNSFKKYVPLPGK